MSANLLIQEPPLQVLPSLAKAVGLNEAIVLQQLHWLGLRHGVPYRATLETMVAENFTFWTTRTLKRVLASLRQRGLLEVDQGESYDRTNGYRVVYEALETAAYRAARPTGQVVPMDEDTLSPSKRSDRPHVARASDGSTSEERQRDTPQPSADPHDGAEVVSLWSDELDEAGAILARVPVGRGGKRATRAALAALREDFPEADLPQKARDLLFWATHGRGAQREIKSVAGTLRTFCRDDPPNGGGRSTVANRADANMAMAEEWVREAMEAE